MGQELLQLEEVVVTASRLQDRYADLPTNVSVIGRDEIEAGGALTAGDALKDLTGVTDVSDRGSRGSGQDVRGKMAVGGHAQYARR